MKNLQNVYLFRKIFEIKKQTGFFENFFFVVLRSAGDEFLNFFVDLNQTFNFLHFLNRKFRFLKFFSKVCKKINCGFSPKI